MDAGDFLFVALIIVAALGGAIYALGRWSANRNAALGPPDPILKLPQPPAPKATLSDPWAPLRDPRIRNETFQEVIFGQLAAPVARYFYCSVAGTSHRNPDRSSRAKNIQESNCGDILSLIWQPANHFDPNAIAVYNEEGQIGFLQARDAADMVRDMKRRGMRHLAFFRCANHHPETDRIVGATIFVVYLEMEGAPLPADKEPLEVNLEPPPCFKPMTQLA